MPPKCYHCNQPRHRSNECPQRRVSNLITDVQENEEFEDSTRPDKNDTEEVYLTEDNDERVNYVVQKGVALSNIFS